jgi:anti-sigma factor RsiW
MFCDEALDSVESIAAGDLTPDGRVANHLATCPNCAAALEDARQLDRMLRMRPVPRPPSQFTARTLTRVRRVRWRSEQFVDVGFNVVIAAVVIAVGGAIWMILHRSGLATVTTDAVDLFTAGIRTIVLRIGPSVPIYAGATALLVSALAVWWWAERDAAL